MGALGRSKVIFEDLEEPHSFARPENVFLNQGHRRDGLLVSGLLEIASQQAEACHAAATSDFVATVHLNDLGTNRIHSYQFQPQFPPHVRAKRTLMAPVWSGVVHAHGPVVSGATPVVGGPTE